MDYHQQAKNRRRDTKRPRMVPADNGVTHNILAKKD